MKKKILLFLFAVLLLPGNIYLVYLFLSSPSRKMGFKISGNPDDFICWWGKNRANLVVEDDNINVAGVVSPESNLHFVAAQKSFLLTYNHTLIIDFNRDFLADYIKKPDGKEYIRIDGRYVPVISSNLQYDTVTFPDGKVLSWKNNQWQDVQKKMPR